MRNKEITHEKKRCTHPKNIYVDSKVSLIWTESEKGIIRITNDLMERISSNFKLQKLFLSISISIITQYNKYNY